jgi:sugar diacid utilization regulator
MNLKNLKTVLSLKAGEEGLNHGIRWIYFADCLQCVQREYKITNYIHGGEFVILTNRSVTDNNKKLMTLVSTMQENDIAALGINEGQISDELIEYCDNNNLPLFELPEEFPLIDLSQILCQELVKEESNRSSKEQLFSTILNSEYLNKENILSQAKALNICMTGKLSIVEIAFKKNREKTKSNDESMLELGQRIKRIINMEFSSLEKILILPQMDSVLLLYPIEKIGEEKTEKVLSRILNRIEQSCPVVVDIGVGNETDYLEDIKESRREAAAAIRIARQSKNLSNHIHFYKNQGVYSLISSISDVRLLDQFVENHIGALIRVDELNESKLCETLENYIHHNCNVKETAADMYIHRNTLNYRLKKIREVLGYDFDTVENCVLIKLAFVIRDYRKWRKLN